MNETSLDEFVAEKGQSEAARLLGVTPPAIYKAIAARRHIRAAPALLHLVATGPSTTATAAPAWTGMAQTIRKAPEIRAALLTASTRRRLRSPSDSLSAGQLAAQWRRQHGPDPNESEAAHARAAHHASQRSPWPTADHQPHAQQRSQQGNQHPAGAAPGGDAGRH